MSDSPCLRCPLPDCDEASRMCLLRRAANTYSTLQKKGEAGSITEEVRAGYNEHFQIWKLEDLARKSEQQPDR